MSNALEIDFLPVGDGSKGGDAIALRFGNYESGKWKSQTVFVIDGGNVASGEALVTHVNEVYKTDKVNRVILTHPDIDHASGLRTVVSELEVGKIWMHRPWNHWPDLQDSIKDGRITKKSFDQHLKDTYQFAYEIEQLANKKKIPIFAPKQGSFFKEDGKPVLTVLGPSKDAYIKLLQSSKKTPEMTMQESLEKAFSELMEEAIIETMDFSTEHIAEENCTTSCENNMSLVLYLTVAGKKILFTGDAGTAGLFDAIAFAKSKGIDLTKLDRFQVPHHGSKNNISKKILEEIYAPTAYISCSAKGEPCHPNGSVINALHRREIKVYQTKGTSHYFHTPTDLSRSGYSAATPVPFQSVVEVSS
ncbi:MBL fold metallo-hydrolase [Sediminibacterium roseum]|uniref:MBL fold metallo-hydrolase n=1 Tax=Sediminibacterium roseum TaxID=1978412 RepID=A0ABW9ZWG5_9BACT|nr:MBL fold metallo-hydrolase [Sediminibacterium roseum]NCI51354.1 MBL fold metallo-hydrolase [Sediminibacterium roseum]